MIPSLVLAACAVIGIRALCMAAHIKREEWVGRPFLFAFLALSYALCLGGALAVAVNWCYGPELLTIGFACLLLTDRRKWTDKPQTWLAELKRRIGKLKKWGDRVGA